MDISHLDQNDKEEDHDDHDDGHDDDVLIITIRFVCDCQRQNRQPQHQQELQLLLSAAEERKLHLQSSFLVS